VSDAYRKMRNTIRFMLSNLYDFDPATDSVDLDAMTDLDRWALDKFAGVTDRVVKAYLSYEFHKVYHSLHNFCGTDMSSLYLDIIKDRLYVSAPDSTKRRAAQTAIHRILDGLLKLMSPILSFTTAEAWEHLRGGGEEMPVEESLFFAAFPGTDDLRVDADFSRTWERLLDIRGEITRVLEAARRDKIIGLSLDAEVLVQVEGETADFLADKWSQLQEICIVSKLVHVDDFAGAQGVTVTESEEIRGLKIAVRPAPGGKCERCWTLATSVGQDSDHPTICGRCVEVVRSLNG
ncbi:MAG TPA: isoleucine--tRNA ligase, partial [Desulfobacteraceae bacterium]|nr:isoleucine--tRNA ligase [Desulfobacteraceae bacterium]